jgi:hippurate hydrolase
MLQNDMIDALAPDIIALRHEIHRQPELGFEERHTADLIAVGEGAHLGLGAGTVGPGECLHGDRYVFNDTLIPIGLLYWQELAAAALPLGGRDAARDRRPEP